MCGLVNSSEFVSGRGFLLHCTCLEVFLLILIFNIKLLTFLLIEINFSFVYETEKPYLHFRDVA